MDYPELPAQARTERLEPPMGKVRMALDTDARNQIDDQFAITYALLSSEAMEVTAMCAAPFHNPRSSGPADGMEQSYAELQRIFELMNLDPESRVHHGADRFLESENEPVDCPAARAIISQAAKEDKPLYVAGIGALTNVASAILLDPEIIRRIVVVWLGGHSTHWPHTKEFNMTQDQHAARVVFNCGVPLVQIPCLGVASHMLTTLPELDIYVKGKGAIGDYLHEIFREHSPDHFARAKPIWDLSAVAWLVNSVWLPSGLIRSPVITSEMTYAFDDDRHHIRAARWVDRNAVFADFFSKLANHAAE